MDSLIGICGCVNNVEIEEDPSSNPKGEAQGTTKNELSSETKPERKLVSKVSKDDSIDTNNTSRTPELQLDDLDDEPSSQPNQTPNHKSPTFSDNMNARKSVDNSPASSGRRHQWDAKYRANLRFFDSLSSTSGGTVSSSSFATIKDNEFFSSMHLRSLSNELDNTIPRFKLQRRTKSFSDIPEFGGGNTRQGPINGDGSPSAVVPKRKRLVATNSDISSLSNATSTRSFDDSTTSGGLNSSPFRSRKSSQQQTQPLPPHSPPPKSPDSKRRHLRNSSTISPRSSDLLHPLSTVERCAEDVPPWIIDVPNNNNINESPTSSSSRTRVPMMPMSMLMPNGGAASNSVRRRPPLAPPSTSLPNFLTSPPHVRRTSRCEEEERIVFDLSLLEREDRLRRFRDSLSFGSESSDNDEIGDGKDCINLNRNNSNAVYGSPANIEIHSLMGESIALSTSEDERIEDDDDQDLAGIEILSNIMDVDGDDS